MLVRSVDPLSFPDSPSLPSTEELLKCLPNYKRRVTTIANSLDYLFGSVGNLRLVVTEQKDLFDKVIEKYHNGITQYTTCISDLQNKPQIVEQVA